jgi:hypothetical protein
MDETNFSDENAHEWSTVKEKIIWESGAQKQHC